MLQVCRQDIWEYRLITVSRQSTCSGVKSLPQYSVTSNVFVVSLAQIIYVTRHTEAVGENCPIIQIALFIVVL